MESNNDEVSRYSLLHGDCLELMADMPDGSVDMILCDLPYGTTNCKWDVLIPFEPLWVHYKRVIKGNGAIVLFSSQPFTTDLIMSNRKMFRYEIIWQKTLKTGFLSANNRPLKGHENITVFYIKTPTYNPQKYTIETTKRIRVKKADRCVLYGHVKEQNYVDNGERYPDTVIKFSNCNYNSLHPTQKPVPLLEYLIRTYTNEGETVLDNCMGSGSTGVACLNTGRRFIGMELDGKYFEVAKERIQAYAKQGKLF